ncbi:hypothetical protein VTK73DRAFT_4656 [Phialemonium thermophilum]|uniref:Polynucleotide 5'-hydroxyl-kinase GRC3 n=1 Tax=Phialemonium thermophilum TaxID=223376 RepID=A0ABR3V7L1_9PEZI
MWRELVGRLAEVVERRLAEEAPVRAAGVIVDTPGVPAGKTGVDFLAHAIDEFSVNIVVVLGSARLNVELQRRYAQGKTRSGQPITVVLLDKSEGVVERDEAFMQQVAEGAIREYFYGNAKRTLSPVIQQVDFGVVAIFKIPEPSEYIADDLVLEKVDPIPDMAHWTLAVMHASVQDPVEKIRTAAVKGFVYVASVDVEKRRLKILAPIPYGLGESPLVWGRWPEPNINLLG